MVALPVGCQVWSNGGMEYSLLIGACALFFLIRGGGDYALDRAIGREI